MEGSSPDSPHSSYTQKRAEPPPWCPSRTAPQPHKQQLSGSRGQEGRKRWRRGTCTGVACRDYSGQIRQLGLDLLSPQIFLALVVWGISGQKKKVTRVCCWKIVWSQLWCVMSPLFLGLIYTTSVHTTRKCTWADVCLTFSFLSPCLPPHSDKNEQKLKRKDISEMQQTDEKDLPWRK